MKNILFCLNSTHDNTKTEDKIIEKYNSEHPDDHITYTKEIYLDGVIQNLNEQHYDVVVVYEMFENIALDVEKLGKTSERCNKTRFVVIMEKEHKKDEFVKKLFFEYGISDLLYTEDFNLSSIVSLIHDGRDRTESKIYLDLIKVEYEGEDKDKLLTEDEIESICQLLKNSDDINAIFDGLATQYSEKKIVFLIKKLPESLKKKLKNSEKFKEFELLLTEYHTIEIPVEVIVTKEKVIEKVIEQHVEVEKHIIPEDYKKCVVFTGLANHGVTSLMHFAIESILESKSDLKIAVLDITNSFYNRFAIHSENSGEYSLLKSFKGDKYDIYSLGKEAKIPTKDEFIGVIESIKPLYDVILIDASCYFDSEYFNNCNNIFIVAEESLQDTEELKKYLKKLESNIVIKNKLCMIINKVSTSLTSDHLDLFREYIKTDNEYKVNICVDYLKSCNDYYISGDYALVKSDARKQKSIKEIAEIIYPLNKNKFKIEFKNIFKNQLGSKKK